MHSRPLMSLERAGYTWLPRLTCDMPTLRSFVSVSLSVVCVDQTNLRLAVWSSVLQCPFLRVQAIISTAVSG